MAEFVQQSPAQSQPDLEGAHQRPEPPPREPLQAGHLGQQLTPIQRQWSFQRASKGPTPKSQWRRQAGSSNVES